MRNLLQNVLAFLRNPGRIRRLWVYEHPGGETVIELRQPLILAAVFVALVWYIISPIPVTSMVFTALAGVLLISFLWARTMALKVTARRRLRYSAFQVGDELEEIINLENPTNLPVLWAEFVDRSNIPGYNVASVRSADASTALEWRAHTICEQRGVYTLGPWELLIGEPFGLFTVHKRYDDRKEIVVYPPLAPLPPILLPHRSTIGSHRPLRQPLAAETIDATTTRPFASGDTLRRVHWPTTARRDEPFVKVFEPETSSTVWLVPDFDASVQAGSGPKSTVEISIILVASLASHLLQERLAVGLFTVTSRPHAVLPQPSKTHLWAILRALAPLQPVPGQPFDQTILHARGLISPNDMVIAITPSLDLEWARRLSSAFGRQPTGVNLRRAQAILLDPASFSSPGGAPAQPSPAGALLSQLASLGIPASVVRRDDVRPVLGAHGAVRRWEFKTTGTGRVVVSQAPREAEQDRFQ